MEINKVTTAKKVGEIVLRNEDNPNLIKPLWVNPKSELFKDNNGRVYFLVINGMIYKIGGSLCKGGIKSTIRSYTDCMKGGPSDRSYIIHYLIYRELVKGHKVEIYMITSPKVMAPVTGLYGVENSEMLPLLRKWRDYVLINILNLKNVILNGISKKVIPNILQT